MNLKKLQTFLYSLPCLGIMALILYLSCTNAGIAKKLLLSTPPGQFAEITQELEGEISENLKQKYDYIELNGMLHRVLGIHTLNDRWKLENGMLTMIPEEADPEAWVSQMKGLSDALESSNIGFLCVPVSRAEYSRSAHPAPGYELGTAYTEALFSLLEQQQINHLDIDAWYLNNGWSLEDIYFKTDHHWRPEAAFCATQEIMRSLSSRYDVIYEEAMFSPDQWEVTVLKEWLLGSIGKRTGAGYAGIDDLSYIAPKFPTDITFNFVSAKGQVNIYPRNSVYSAWHMNQHDLYEQNPYCLYLGGDYPIVHIRNNLALNDKTVIIAGDSFRLPVEAFLSTQFQEIYHIDLRYYRNGTFMEFVNQIEPDFVLFIGSSNENDKRVQFETEKWNETFCGKTPGKALVQKDFLQFDAAADNEDCYLLAGNLEPGAYELSIAGSLLERSVKQDETETAGGFLNFVLVDLKTQTPYASRYFLANEEASQKWLFTIPEDASANFGILVYNGSKGYTLGNTAVIQDIQLKPYQ